MWHKRCRSSHLQSVQSIYLLSTTVHNLSTCKIHPVHPPTFPKSHLMTLKSRMLSSKSCPVLMRFFGCSSFSMVPLDFWRTVNKRFQLSSSHIPPCTGSQACIPVQKREKRETHSSHCPTAVQKSVVANSLIRSPTCSLGVSTSSRIHLPSIWHDFLSYSSFSIVNGLLLPLSSFLILLPAESSSWAQRPHPLHFMVYLSF